ncbi:MAG TPA: hypothetical protein VNG51_21855 [Ktedonobacteraceae bacterium]|nr:hypothetical protein [Ktedonobacteraceae bacterium]
MADINPISELIQIEQKLSGTPDWYSPLSWRRMAAPSGILGLDLPYRVNGENWKARQMAEIFAFCGKINLDLRDVPGGGHSRLLLEPVRDSNSKTGQGLEKAVH